MSTEFGQSFCRMNYRNRQELSSGRPKMLSAQGMNNSYHFYLSCKSKGMAKTRKLNYRFQISKFPLV